MVPEEVFSMLQKYASNKTINGLFRTEKFGTATILLEHGFGEMHEYKYEITPFRQESWYTDRRHPTMVSWSNSLVSDAQRRDFTVNALYYTSFSISPADWMVSDGIDDANLNIKTLDREWRYFEQSSNLLIIKNCEIIESLLLEWDISFERCEAFLQNTWIECDISRWLRVLFDPTWWILDIESKKLRTVWDADKRFNEDALRILRALRFVNIWNQRWLPFDFHKDTRTSIKKQYHLVQYLAKERIREEIVKVFSANNPFGYVALLDEANILQYIFPALHRCKYNEQPIRYHPFDTYSHILLTLWNLQKINTNYLVKLWMLYHDVGKPDQYHYYAQCRTREEIEALHGSWYNHIVCGAEFTERDFSALAFSQKEIEEISWYVSMHMRPWQILEARDDNQRKKVRLLYSEFGFERVKNLFDICRADRLWQFNPIQSSEVDVVDSLYEHLYYLRDSEGQFTPSDMAINGDDIMKEFDLAPGKIIWDLLKKAFEWVVHEKDNRNVKKTILSYLKGILAHGG